MILDIHGVGKNFNLDEFLHARAQSILAVKKVSSCVEVGMTEDDGIDLIERTLKEFGVQKYWHPSKFRIDQNTTLNFRDVSDQSAVISNESIYSIDIGPVFGMYEGDYGETFSLSENEAHQKLIKATRDIFDSTVEYWKNHDCSGAELYQFSSEQAESLGYKLNNKMKGHRLGDFPHHLYCRRGLSEIDRKPLANLWVLEIHLIDQSISRGAFFEDIFMS